MLGASIPRSGHAFLYTLLSGYFGEDLHYCEYYTPPNCCKSIPCIRGQGHSVAFQKSHDRDFKVPRGIEGALYLVQYRHPVPEALSDFELEVRDGFGRTFTAYRQSKEHYVEWLAEKAIYYRKFHDKWMRSRTADTVYLDYEELSTRTADLLRPIILWGKGEVDENRLGAVVEKASGTRVGRLPSAPETFTPRVVEDSPHFDRELLGAFEDFVLERCPAFGFPRYLSGSYRDSPLYGLIILNDPDEPLPNGTADRLANAAQQAPGHPEIQRRYAQLAFRDRQSDEALERLRILLGQYPFYAPGYRLLFNVCRKSDRPVPEWALTGDALLACSSSADLLTEIGAAFWNNRQLSLAVMALSTAVALDPQHVRAHHLLAVVLSSERRWAQARHYAEKAAILDPKHEANSRFLANLQKRLSG
jgi:hypothetical protein